jgi:hypothetical protein
MKSLDRRLTYTVAIIAALSLLAGSIVFFFNQGFLIFLVMPSVLGAIVGAYFSLKNRRARLTAGYLALLQLADLSPNPTLQQSGYAPHKSEVKKTLYAFNPTDVFNFLGKRHKAAVRSLLEHRMPKPSS